MEGFSLKDIYDTKGAEYLFVIGYLIVLIIFWRIIRNPRRTISRIREAIGTLSASILNVPQGIYFNRNHTWAHLSESGTAKVGMDDFFQHVVGEVQVSGLKTPGSWIKKGEQMAEIEQNGKVLKVYSPLSGEVLDTNDELGGSPEIMNNDPFGLGWIYRIRPDNWKKETGACLVGGEASAWSKEEIGRFKDFLSGGPMKEYSSRPSMVLLQDGGEIRDKVLSELPDEVWKNFQAEFMDVKKQEK